MERPLTTIEPGTALRLRTEALRRAIAAMDLVVSATLHCRTKSCVRAGYKRKDDVTARHGPYLE